MSQVRIALPQDEDRIFLAVQAIHETGEWGLRYSDGSPFPFCEERTRATIRQGLTGKDAWIGVIGDAGEAEASIYLHTAQPFCSEAPFLAELWSIVLPAYRGSDHAKQLLEFSKDLAKAVNLPLVIGVMSHERTAAKCRLFSQRLGQPPIGELFVYHHQNDASASKVPS